MYVRGANQDVDITDNQLLGSSASGGISLVAPDPLAPTPSTGIVIRGNSVERFNIGILVAANAKTTDTKVLENVTRLNRISGIQIGPTNTSALVQANVSELNAYGIRTATAQVTGNFILENSMHLNTVLDAAESSFTTEAGLTTLNNTWLNNQCATDSPTDAICVN